MKSKSVVAVCLTVLLSFTSLISCGTDKAPGGTSGSSANVSKLPQWDESQHLTYMLHYGLVDDRVIEVAKEYDVVILHPKMANLTADQVQEIRSAGTCVLGYISIGEDLRTAGMTAEEMIKDKRFTGDKSGPRVDPRPKGTIDLDNVDPLGKASPGGKCYASYYLDDNDFDGKPDINVNFNCAFTNIGDPVWFEVLDKMQLDKEDKVAGLREILTDDYGRGLGCDGVFLDTIDTCAPNKYTSDSEAYKTRFEWTAPGVPDFIERLKKQYPDKLILQNRGLFFYDPRLPQFDYSPRKNIDFLLFESYMLDSNFDKLYEEGYYAENKFSCAPKIMAEAGRPDGFRVLSLGYAEGPAEYRLIETLLGKSDVGLGILLEDMNEAQNAGFSHYITDAKVELVNDFVITHEDKTDTSPPVWSNTYNDFITWPITPLPTRVGIGQVEPVTEGMTVRWDVALDRNKVSYTLYYQKAPFDFGADPELAAAQKVDLIPEMGEGYCYGAGPENYPYQATIQGLDAGETYYFVIRAKDASQNKNEDKNTVVQKGVPLN